MILASSFFLALLLSSGSRAQSSISNSAVLNGSNISNLTISNTQAALAFERSNWANGSVEEDDFYRVPANSSDLPAGTLLKLETYTNTSLYTVPPQTALSRILYQTKDFNGSLVPASAFIQWPYHPRSQPDGTYPIVAWAHGTSGAFPACAPSHIRNLWYQFTAPYPLALQGYVVVAPDYAGLGVSRTASGKATIHQYLASPAAANDLFYAVEAAQSAFPKLSKEFVVMGHSQGGGAAWAAAERQARVPVKGYLGAVAGSPVTSFVENLQLGAATLGLEAALAASAYEGTIVMQGLTSLFPDFDVATVLTPGGVERLNLLKEIQGCNSAGSALLKGQTTPLIRPEALGNGYVNAFQKLVGTGGMKIAGPMLVLQGTNDTNVPAPITTKYVNLTCTLFPESAIEYAVYEGATHVPAMYASQRKWLGWIEDRFAGKASKGCRTVERTSVLPQINYQAEVNWFLEYATQSFEVA
ncbi:MAG: hypothetical protein L6R41_000296 [Letrouitia leprolyta]|nr:MAG: hypothetical protein L6R41_000296 [Letrouitia leprolyta]